jgi:hypothetical protein
MFLLPPHRREFVKIFQISSAVTQLLGLMEDPSVLRCYAVFISKELQTFQKIKVPSPSEPKTSRRWKKYDRSKRWQRQGIS